MRWDIFCKVIDNHGDIGVCWRLSTDLAARGQDVRLWVDDPGALAWMAPLGAPGVEVHHWHDGTDWPGPGDVLVEAFGCDPAPAFVTAYARAWGDSARWINLEYLSAESFVERVHGLPSPVAHGPGAGGTKHFFYPGFTPRTGGLLREAGLPQRQATFDARDWALRHGVADTGARRVSLFCYEPPALGALLRQLAQGEAPTQLLVTSGRAASAVRAALAAQPALAGGDRLTLHWLPLMTQADFDELLWACDFNFVRGEDSLVRALWAGKPFAWHIYPQQDDAHHAKLDAFVRRLAPPADWARFMRVWNGLDADTLPPLDIAAWQDAATAFAGQLRAQDDLVTQLLRFVAKKR
jgi:uncharacterized repeat protein (TIGR03837 family)